MWYDTNKEYLIFYIQDLGTQSRARRESLLSGTSNSGTQVKSGQKSLVIDSIFKLKKFNQLSEPYFSNSRLTLKYGRGGGGGAQRNFGYLGGPKAPT